MTVPTDSSTPAADAASSSSELPGVAFITFVLENLIEDHDELHIESRTDDLGILISVKVSQNDMGKLIGKSGQTIKSLRTLLRTLGGKLNQRINLKVIEPMQTV